MSLSDFFSRTYQESETRFVSAARAQGFQLKEYLYPDHIRGAEGEELKTLAAYKGPEKPEKLYVLTSGTHGVEAYAGTAIINAALEKSYFDRLPEGVGVLLVHAINPFGMSHYTRDDQEGVDLNRNFRDFDTPLPSPPNLVHFFNRLFLLGIEGIPESEQKQLQSIFLGNHMNLVVTGLASGQYVLPEGLFFGGTKKSLSTEYWQDIVKTFVPSEAQIIHVDVHTALGPYGHGDLLVPAAVGSPLYDRVISIFGDKGHSPLGGDVAIYTPNGMMNEAIIGDHEGSNVISLSLEFGTVAPAQVLKALLLSKRAFMGNFQDPALTLAAKQAFGEACCPTDPLWREAVVSRGLRVTHQALAALKGTPDPQSTCELT